MKDAKIENKPNAKMDSLLEMYTSKTSKSQVSQPNNQMNELQKDVRGEIKETRRRSVEIAKQQGRLSKEIEFRVPIAGNKVNGSKEISELDADRYIPRYETIMSPVNDPRYFRHESFDPIEKLSRKRTSKVQGSDPKDDYNQNMRIEVTNGTNISPASLQIRSISESFLLEGENQNSKNTSFDLQGVVPINEKFASHLNNKESHENSNIEIKSANRNIQYSNRTILDFKDASKITLNSKIHLVPASNSKNSINYGDAKETAHYDRRYRLEQSDSDYDEASKTTKNNKICLESRTAENNSPYNNGTQNCSFVENPGSTKTDNVLKRYDRLEGVSEMNKNGVNGNLTENIQNVSNHIHSEELIVGSNENSINAHYKTDNILTSYGKNHARKPLDTSKITLSSNARLPVDDPTPKRNSYSIIKNITNVTNSIAPKVDVSKTQINGGSTHNFVKEYNEEFQNLSDYNRTRDHSPSNKNVDNASRISNHNELQIPRTQDALNEENVSNILSRYGTDYSAPNFDDASRIALYNKSHIHFKDIEKNKAKYNVRRPIEYDQTPEVCNHTIGNDTKTSQNGDADNMKISKNGELSYKLNNNTIVQQRQMSKEPKQFSSKLNDNNYDKKTSNSLSGATENRLKISENNDKSNRKCSKDSYQLSNNLTINSINKQKEISKDTHQSSNKLNDHINDQVKKPSNKSGNNVTQNQNKESRKFSKDSQHNLNKNNNSEIRKSSNVCNQSSNVLNDRFVNRNVRRYSQESQQLSNTLNKKVRKSDQTSGVAIQESIKTATLSTYPDKRLSGLTNDNANELTRQCVNTKNISSLQPIRDSISLKESECRRSASIDQTRGNDYSTFGTANNRKHDRQLISQTNNNEQSFQPQWKQTSRSNPTQTNNKSNLQIDSESDKPIHAIRYRTDYSKYFGCESPKEYGSTISSTVSTSPGDPTDKNKDSFYNNYNIKDATNGLIAQECHERDNSTQDSQEINKTTPARDHFKSSDASVQVDYNAKLRRKIQRCRNLKDENIKECCDCPEHINVDVHFDITNATCRHRNKRFASANCVCITEGMNTDVNDIKKTICFKNDAMVRDFLNNRSSTGEVSTNIYDAYSADSI